LDVGWFFSGSETVENMSSLLVFKFVGGNGVALALKASPCFCCCEKNVCNDVKALELRFCWTILFVTFFSVLYLVGVILLREESAREVGGTVGEVELEVEREGIGSMNFSASETEDSSHVLNDGRLGGGSFTMVVSVGCVEH
jgi:hypothetical protein